MRRGQARPRVALSSVRLRSATNHACDTVTLPPKQLAEFGSILPKVMAPISVVDGVGFQELMGYVEPNYIIPSRQNRHPSH